MGANARQRLERSQAAAQQAQSLEAVPQPWAGAALARLGQPPPQQPHGRLTQLLAAGSAPGALQQSRPAQEGPARCRVSQLQPPEHQGATQAACPQRPLGCTGLHAAGSAPGQLQGSAGLPLRDEAEVVDLTAVDLGEQERLLAGAKAAAALRALARQRSGLRAPGVKVHNIFTRPPRQRSAA